MVDFQGVCLRRTLRNEKSAGIHLRGVRSDPALFEILSSLLSSDPSRNPRDVLESDQSSCHVNNHW